ncbi:MAG TPA: ATP-binding protein [Solirubrobacterales bacterium]|nr:ATP-binding protein [Solirubrobacterales bacterium]
MTAREFRLTLPATAENVIVVRQAVAGLGEVLGLSPQRLADLKTVISEACNNVVLHAYEGEPGPLEVSAEPRSGELEIQVSDRGAGFQPRANEGDPSLGLGLPLIAALSDSFEISGGAGQGSRTTIRFSYEAPESANNGTGVDAQAPEALEMAITPGELVKPVLARVMGALAARAEFSVDRLADTVLLGDAVSSSGEGDFADGRVGIKIQDGDGTLGVRVGPLVEGAGERLLDEMDLPGAGSLRSLTSRMEVTTGETAQGEKAEFLEFEVTS